MSEQNSNSKQMTFEEKVVQHIKEQSIAVLLDDEEALTDLTRRAVHEALFKDRSTTNGYSTTKQEALIFEYSRKIAERALNKLVEQEVEKLVGNPEVLASLRSALILMLPKVAEQAMSGFYNRLTEESAREGLEKLKQIGIINGNASF